MLGPLLQVEVYDHVYPRIRPPRYHRYFKCGAVVQFASREFHATHPFGHPQDLEKLLAAPLPLGGRKEERGGLVAFRWADKLTNEKKLAVGRSLQEQWLTSVLDLPIDGSYNELGDYLVAPAGGEHPPLTFYTPASALGYKAVMVDTDGRMGEKTSVEMTGWIKARELPDGTPLHSLDLIVPSRTAALRIYERAKAMGVSRVLYTDDSGRFWDPHPPGLWLE